MVAWLLLNCGQNDNSISRKSFVANEREYDSMAKVRKIYWLMKL